MSLQSLLNPSIAVHVNFFGSMAHTRDLRYIKEQFQKLGGLVYWTDYTTKAGFKHHSGRSMAIYSLPGGQKDFTFIKRRFESIVGIALPRSYEELKNGDVEYIKPYFKVDKGNYDLLQKIKVSHATLNDPFFRISQLDNTFDAKDVKINLSKGIAMVIRVQHIDPESNDIFNARS